MQTLSEYSKGFELQVKMSDVDEDDVPPPLEDCSSLLQSRQQRYVIPRGYHPSKQPLVISNEDKAHLLIAKSKQQNQTQNHKKRRNQMPSDLAFF